MILIVFDVDGTLVDSQHMIVAAQAEAFAAVGLPAPTRERSLSVVGLSLPQAFTALVGADGPVVALSEAYKQAFSASFISSRWRSSLRTFRTKRFRTILMVHALHFKVSISLEAHLLTASAVSAMRHKQ